MNNQTYSKPFRCVWQSLLWKEWHEHKWIMFWLAGLAFLAYLTATLAENASPLWLYLSADPFWILAYGIVVALFLGAKTAASERQRGTIRFLSSLPISMKKTAVWKLAVAWFAISLPILLFVIAILITAPKMLDAHLVFGRVLPQIAVVGSLLLWIASSGVKCNDQTRAGASGFLVVSLVWALLVFATQSTVGDRFAELKQWISLATAIAPAGSPFAWESINWVPKWGLFLIALCGHGLLLFWFVTRFGRKPKNNFIGHGGFFARANANPSFAAPRRSQLSAIVWKQIRETGPVASMAIVGVLISIGITWLIQNQENHEGVLLVSTAVSVSLLVTLFSGIGTFQEDMKPGIGRFLHSRPIRLPLWFVIKFFTGLIMLACALVAVTIIGWWMNDGVKHYLSSFRGKYQFITTIFGFVFLYCLGVATFCLSRNSITAAISSILLLFCWACCFAGLGYAYDLHVDDEKSWILARGFAAVGGLILTLAGYAAVKRNWCKQ